jgi:hypothetical protein
MTPASIRTKNPGAMWGISGKRTTTSVEAATTNALARKWGSVTTIYLSDGLGQGNNIAVFPSYVDGICAQLDLWRTSPYYKDKRFADAIHTWSGGNNTPSYIQYVKQRVPGMTEDTVMDDAFWRGPMAIGFLKAQAAHEAGVHYPAADADWLEAQKRVFSKKPQAKHIVAGAVIVGGGVAAQQAHAAGFSGAAVVGIIVATVVLAMVGFMVWTFVLERRSMP